MGPKFQNVNCRRVIGTLALLDKPAVAPDGLGSDILAAQGGVWLLLVGESWCGARRF